MSDSIKHECGVALIRLRKPIRYYYEKYGTTLYGLNKLYLLMEKQHNRGQDGAGVATIKLNVAPGERYISRIRSNDPQPIKDIFKRIHKHFEDENVENPGVLQNPEEAKRQLPYLGELLLGHLRYGTHGGNSIENCHPFLRQNNWMSRNLVVAGNFNLTNNDELFDNLVQLGQHPKESVDTVTVMEKIGHFLDEENQRLFDQFNSQGFDNLQITQAIQDHIDLERILVRSTRNFDGGYLMAGLLGHGDAFILRDPGGIRPGHYYVDDEVVVVASERQAIKTAFNVPMDSINSIGPGNALIIKKDGSVSEKSILPQNELKQCSFERIYFSRGNDFNIYTERKKLGELIVPTILDAINYDLANTVFSYIPNTAETAFYGMIKGLESYLNEFRVNEILNMNGNIDRTRLEELMQMRPRVEKAAIKDVKMRTFITEEKHRDDLVAHVYDTTYGILDPGKDTLVVIDDSIVRGTTLKTSILTILDRLEPKKIIIVSSAPQIRYTDCYGIDMSLMDDFIAFRAAIALLKEHGLEHIIQETYQKCKDTLKMPKELVQNEVKAIYAPFSDDEISAKIAEIVTPNHIKAEVQVIYQTIENLHVASPRHTGDWYFSGDYPTPGGNKVVNKAFTNYVEGIRVRAY